MIDDILSQVHKPGRYIGQEWNISKKDFGGADIRFALCFPDLYEVGMSNLGVRILYGILNNIPDVVCERFFAVASDMEAALVNNSKEIFSLESKKGLREFDIVGFSLAHELNYTNVLNMLKLGGIPLSSSARGNLHPLIIGGGPCVMNPEPMHEFFDLFVIGEAEEAIVELVDIYRRLKPDLRSGKIDKKELLLALSAVQGVYIPSFYEVTYKDDGSIDEFRPKAQGAPMSIKKRIVGDLNKSYFPVNWIVPYIQIVHDRITLEVMRGCPNRCRFCQGRSQYYPFRQRSVENILNLASSAYACTGYDDISLVGLSVSDYANVEVLVGNLFEFFRGKFVSVSLPSIKPHSRIAGNLAALISGVKKTGLTFAPEAATESLRSAIGKYFDLDSFYQSLRQAYESGYQHVKLYFMIGLPGEEPRDLDAILDFVMSVSNLRREIVKRPAHVNISVNTLIPKPHTPFQWFGMPSLDVIKLKQDYLRKKANNRLFKLSFHNSYMSVIEGVLSRGDRRLSQVILKAFENGAKFDAWEDNFVYERWMNAFSQCNIDPVFYLKGKLIEDKLPWDFIDVGISKEALVAEYNKARQIS